MQTEENQMFETEVTLPSLGKFDAGKIPDGKVRLRPIGVTEEKYLVSAKNRLVAADKILSRCVINCAVSMSDMLMTDKFFLLLCLRNVSYGPEYSFKLTCRCQYEFPYTVIIPDGLKLAIAAEGDVEPFDVALPVSKKTLSLRFLRGYDEEAIEAYSAQLTPAQIADEGDPAYAYRMSRHIVSVNGTAIDSLAALHLCESLIGRDSLALRTAITSHETGAKLTVSTTCPKCRKELVSPIQFTSDFFPVSVS